jgi:lysozyme
MLNGFDVYAGSGEIAWQQAQQAGNVFAFVRGAYGTAPDKAAAAHTAAARASGLKTGIYHFFRARLDPAAQIATMLGALDAVKYQCGDLLPVLDVEDNPAFDGPWNVADNSAYLAAIEQWIQAVEKKVGKPPIIYTRSSFWTQLGNPSGFSGCPLWVASYRTGAPKLPSGWDAYAFWQYTDSGTIPGLSGHADMSYFNGDDAGLAALTI